MTESTDSLGRNGSEGGGDFLGREPAPLDPPQTTTEFAEQRDDLPDDAQQQLDDGGTDDGAEQPEQTRE